MVYVVYNLKLESCLMRDEFIQPPSENQGDVDQQSLSQGAAESCDGIASQAGSVLTSQGDNGPTLLVSKPEQREPTF